MKRITWFLLAVLGLLFLPSTRAQEVPGLSVGGFVEQRTDNRIGGEELSFQYFGVRLKIRDERFFEGFLDLGMQPMDFGSMSANDAGCFGLGGTCWLLRAEDFALPLDIGAYGSYHIANYTLTEISGPETDAKYGRFMGQAVVRAEGYGGIRPYLRAGVMGSNLDPESEAGVVSGEDLDKTGPAVNVGFEIGVDDKLILTVEGNYAQSVGGALHFDYWF
jgi:opacity protein-like surface antigen